MTEKKYKAVDAGEFFNFEKEGDSVCGVLVDITEEFGANKSKVYKLRQENDQIVNVWDNVVLSDKMKLVGINSDIRITYLGKKKSKDGSREYNDFSVEIAVVEE